MDSSENISFTVFLFFSSLFLSVSSEACNPVDKEALHHFKQQEQGLTHLICYSPGMFPPIVALIGKVFHVIPQEESLMCGVQALFGGTASLWILT